MRPCPGPCASLALESTFGRAYTERAFKRRSTIRTTRRPGMTPNPDRPLFGWFVHVRGALSLSAAIAGSSLAWASTGPEVEVVGLPRLSVDANSAPVPVLGALPGLGPVLSGTDRRGPSYPPVRLDGRLRPSGLRDRAGEGRALSAVPPVRPAPGPSSLELSRAAHARLPVGGPLRAGRRPAPGDRPARPRASARRSRTRPCSASPARARRSRWPTSSPGSASPPW